MTVNPFLMGGSSITSNKPLMVFTGTDPEYSLEDYLNAANIGPEPIITPLHENWIHRRTAFIQTTLDGAPQKWCPKMAPQKFHEDWIHRRLALIQTTLDGAPQKWCPKMAPQKFHEDWIHRRTALIQTTLDGAAQN